MHSGGDSLPMWRHRQFDQASEMEDFCASSSARFDALALTEISQDLRWNVSFIDGNKKGVDVWTLERDGHLVGCASFLRHPSQVSWEIAGFPKRFPEIDVQLRPPVIPCTSEALPEPEIYARMVEALGLVPPAPPELRVVDARAHPRSRPGFRRARRRVQRDHRGGP